MLLKSEQKKEVKFLIIVALEKIWNKTFYHPADCILIYNNKRISNYLNNKKLMSISYFTLLKQCMILYDLYIFISRALMGANLKRWGKVQKSGGKLR